MTDGRADERTDPLGEGDHRRHRTESQGSGDPQRQVTPEDYVWPSFEDIEGALYQLTVRLYGSHDLAGRSFRIENRGLLESALALPHQPYYETFADKLAAMVRSIACNHALVDGNKRLAVTVLHATLVLNGRAWIWSEDDAAALALRAASGANDFRWLAEFIRSCTRLVPNGLETARSYSLSELIDAQREAYAEVWGELPAFLERLFAMLGLPPDAIDIPVALLNVQGAISAMAAGTEESASPQVREMIETIRLMPSLLASPAD